MYAIIDIEATGGSPKRDKIIEIAIYKFDGEKIVDSFTSLLNPGIPIPPFITQLTGISAAMVKNAPRFHEVAKEIVEITEGAIFVAHNVQFDYAYIKAEFRNLAYDFRRKKVCTLQLTKTILPGLPSYSLGSLCQQFELNIENRHRAAGDARATVELFKLLLEKDEESYIQTSINQRLKQEDLPPNLAIEKVKDIPEETGIYYFFNDGGEAIYIGKSIDIQRRVMQHLNRKFENTQKTRMVRSIADITYEITGSELMAEVLEDYKIKNMRPTFNKAQRAKRFPIGIFAFENEQGYLELEARKIKKGELTEAKFNRILTAEKAIWRKVKKYRLCPKLCHVGESDNACFYKEINRCKGACIGEESVNSYNKRVRKAMAKYKYPSPNLLIIGEGRDLVEKSVICVENERFIGMGYYDPEAVKTVNQMRECITHYPENPDADKLVRSFLRKNQLDQVIEYSV